MRTKLPYRSFEDNLGASFDLAVWPVRLATQGNPTTWTDSFEALIDSGASRCVFSDLFAEELGIAIESGMLEYSTGISGSQVMWLHDVMLDVPGGPVKVQVAFQRNLPIFGILGMEGFFEHFIVTFDSLAHECRLDRISRA